MNLSDHGVLLRPILTEKTTFGIEVLNAYVFEVHPSANKVQIRKAVETLFDVKVTKVNVRNRKGKRKRVGKSVGYGKDTKHAVVTLAAGDKLEIY
ncbi:MAG: 50S ribosomal protein L23 [Planctomycetota bacterium]|jgi:large subunit ribosomal protein L23|nr:50S ribosomal protein L23 [Planctomycetota bacterium]HBO51694.1 50S ribosomal protein L23 [Planctomycetota bacterium]|tara:strand:- start:2442 stop:2726 length:285 start_codon:yes stop_codon:yes gene_type:complete